MLISFASFRMSSGENGGRHVTYTPYVTLNGWKWSETIAVSLAGWSQRYTALLLGGIPSSLGRAPRGALFGEARCERTLTEETAPVSKTGCAVLVRSSVTGAWAQAAPASGGPTHI